MDWLRRNWPDLLIGVALVAVIAGIIATLISGGTFFPVGGGSRTADTPTQTAPPVAGSNQGSTQTTTQGAGVIPSQPDGATDSPDVTPQVQGSLDTPAVVLGDTPAQNDAGQTPANQGQPGGIAVLPPDGQASTSTLTTTAPPTTPAATTPPVTTPSATTPPATSQATVTPATNVAASSTPDAPYRVSVGAYGNLDNAQRQLEAFRAAGYPVFLGLQGNLNIVLVGPYDTEAEARSVALRISQSNLGVSDPTVYLLDPDDDAPAASSVVSTTTPPAAQAAATTPAATPASTTQSTAAATGGDRYLQVGAYGSRDSSLPQRQRLEALGFVVSERLESDLVKLLIGPFDDPGLDNAQSRLQAAGIDSFPR